MSQPPASASNSAPAAHAAQHGLVRDGILAALGAYLIWGLVPIFFKQLGHVPAQEIIAHRVLWSLLLVGAFLLARGALSAVLQQARQPRTLAHAAFAAALVMSNWFIFVWAVNADRILETSLGYFITPLLSIVLGVFVLHERLRNRQWLAVALAATGVLIETWRIGSLPWVSLGLAISFGSYGLLRKQMPLDAAGGLFLETLCATPFAALYLAWLGTAGSFSLGNPGSSTNLLLVTAGAVTAIPLLLFAIGARRLPLATLGFLQYTAPSLSFLVAIFFYAEPMNLPRLLAFVAIWGGLALYTLDLMWHARQNRSPHEQNQPTVRN